MPPVEVVVNPLMDSSTDWPGIILGGLVGGLVVLIGVVAAELLIRSRETRGEVRAIVSSLAFDMPILMAYYSDDPEAPALRPGDYHGPFWQLRKDVFTGLNQLRTLPRWPMRNAGKIRKNAELLATLATAAQLRSVRGLPLTRDDQVVIATSDQLHTLVFGTKPVSHDELDRLVKEGFAEPSGDDA